MGCAKCGAKRVPRPTPEYTVEFGPDSDNRTAEVYIQRHIIFDIVPTGTVEFYATQVIRLNFSLIEAILTMYPDSLYIRRAQEKALYEASH